MFPIRCALGGAWLGGLAGRHHHLPSHHSVHTLAPVLENLPPSQLEQFIAVPLEYLPASQATHEVEPWLTPVENPSAQSKQLSVWAEGA